MTITFRQFQNNLCVFDVTRNKFRYIYRRSDWYLLCVISFFEAFFYPKRNFFFIWQFLPDLNGEKVVNTIIEIDIKQLISTLHHNEAVND